MERFTKKAARTAFKRLIHCIGGEVAKSYNDVGKYELDENFEYGGFVINRISNKDGGVSCPFGYLRRNCREFWESCSFAMDSIRETKRCGK